ncbi:MAG: Rrf2 family transcriptional regulator [Acidobacteria bacterium]|nr:Rrf2 family transcriptional regulator [Acidobacteriota bacterium]
MKFTAQEEYGLRCLLQIARQGEGGSLTIPEISVAEGISIPYVGKLVRILRQGGFLRSTRGQTGGYMLARLPEQIILGEVLSLLGGRLFESEYCERFPGIVDMCTHTVDCAIRSLWRAVQQGVDQILSHTTLRDLLSNEQEMASSISGLVKIQAFSTQPQFFSLSNSVGD